MSVSDTCVNIEKYDELKEELYFKRLGKIAGVVGLTIESVGPDARLGDLCRIYKSGVEIIFPQRLSALKTD